MPARVLIVNHGGSTVCGIHDLGLRMRDRLDTETTLDVGYAACASSIELDKACAEHAPDVTIVNYRADLMTWWHRHRWQGVAIGVVHQYEPATAGRAANDLVRAGFDWAMFLDPDLDVTHPQAVTVGRPLPPDVSDEIALAPDPRIGSFGFAFPHKGFVDVAKEVNLVEGAMFDLHMPEAWFNGAEGRPLYGPAIIEACHNEINGRTTFRHTSDHLPPNLLVDRLARNDVNCLLYQPGQPDAGLSSALDYLIAARRPALVSEATMFRHGHPHVAVWPNVGLRDVLYHREAWQRHADALWRQHTGRFAHDVAQLVERLG